MPIILPIHYQRGNTLSGTSTLLPTTGYGGLFGVNWISARLHPALGNGIEAAQ